MVAVVCLWLSIATKTVLQGKSDWSRHVREMHEKKQRSLEKADQPVAQSDTAQSAMRKDAEIARPPPAAQGARRGDLAECEKQNASRRTANDGKTAPRRSAGKDRTGGGHKAAQPCSQSILRAPFEKHSSETIRPRAHGRAA